MGRVSAAIAYSRGTVGQACRGSGMETRTVGDGSERTKLG